MRFQRITNDLGLRNWAAEIHTAILASMTTSQPNNASTVVGSDSDSGPDPKVPTNPLPKPSANQQTGFPRPIDPREMAIQYMSAADLARPIAHYEPLVKDSLDRMNQALIDAENFRGIRLDHITVRKSKGKQLADVVRHFSNSFLARADRMGYPESDKLLVRSSTARPGTNDSLKWVHIADDLIAGEARSVAKGRPEMANPSVGEITNAVADFKAAAYAVREAEREVVAAEARLREAREICSELMLEMASFLRFVYSKVSGGERRRIMRTLGYSFESSHEEESTSTETGSEPNTETGGPTTETPETPTEVMALEQVGKVLQPGSQSPLAEEV